MSVFTGPTGQKTDPWRSENPIHRPGAFPDNDWAIAVYQRHHRGLVQPAKAAVDNNRFPVPAYLARMTEFHGNKILVLAVVLTVVSVVGISLLRVENSFINYFSEDTEIYQGLKFIDEKLGGTTPLEILVKLESDAEELTPEDLKEMVSRFRILIRAKTGRNGATWQSAAVNALQGRGFNRPDALAEMLRLYCERMHSNEPVHTWDLPV